MEGKRQVSGMDLGNPQGSCASCGTRHPDPGHEDMGRTFSTVPENHPHKPCISISRIHVALLITFPRSFSGYGLSLHFVRKRLIMHDVAAT